MSSIDFIDEAGREWAHASRYRALEDENAALRKRVEELNRSNAAHRREHHAALDRAEKAEAESLAARNLGQAHLDRAERAERELAAYKHEAALLDALTQRGITDCSTPSTERVRNIVEALEKAERLLALSRDALLRYFQPGEVGEDVAPRIVEMQESLRERAEKAERELAETRLEWARSVDAAAATRKALQGGLDARQQKKWAEAVASLNVERLKNTGLQADLDALRATSAELDADRLRKHEELHRVKADLDAALLVCTVLGVQYGRAWLSEEARKAGEHVVVLLEKRRVERG